MTSRYALLIAPSSNRVYAGEALRLTEAELAAFGETVMGARLRDLAPVNLAGVPYLGFGTDEPLTGPDITHLSNLSTAYALFAVERSAGGVDDPGAVRLRPVPLTPSARYDDDLLTTLRYPGKTNEQYTQLLLNLTTLGSDRAGRQSDQRLVVLDPLCGRGTTLNLALRYGYDAIGIESDSAHVDAYATFLRTWLRRKRLKHSVELNPVRHDRKRVARRLTATLAPTKEEFQAGDIQRLTLLHADTRQARSLLRPGCCDLIVTDAPYGVGDGGRGSDRSGRVRRPGDLLAEAVPGWVELLRHGGAIGLSFNAQLASRDEVTALLVGAGLTVLETSPYQQLAYRVDHVITRDVLVARKP